MISERTQNIIFCLLLIPAAWIGYHHFFYKNPNYLYVALSFDKPSLAFKDEKAVKIGSEVNLANNLSGLVSKRLVIKESDPSSMLTMLQKKKIDICLSTEIQKKIEGFECLQSKEYASSKLVALVKTNKKISSLEALEDKRIGAQLGSVSEICAKNIAEEFDNSVIFFNNNNQIIPLLKDGHIEAAIIGEISATEFVKKHPELSILELGEYEMAEKYFAYTTDQELLEAFNKVLEANEN